MSIYQLVIFIDFTSMEVSVWYKHNTLSRLASPPKNNKHSFQKELAFPPPPLMLIRKIGEEAGSARCNHAQRQQIHGSSGDPKKKKKRELRVPGKRRTRSGLRGGHEGSATIVMGHQNETSAQPSASSSVRRLFFSFNDSRKR